MIIIKSKIKKNCLVNFFSKRSKTFPTFCSMFSEIFIVQQVIVKKIFYKFHSLAFISRKNVIKIPSLTMSWTVLNLISQRER